MGVSQIDEIPVKKVASSLDGELSAIFTENVGLRFSYLFLIEEAPEEDCSTEGFPE